MPVVLRFRADKQTHTDTAKNNSLLVCPSIAGAQVKISVHTAKVRCQPVSRWRKQQLL